MTLEKTKEIMQKPEIKEAFLTMFLNNLQDQKRNKVNIYRMLNQKVKKGKILLVGSSLMEWFPINEMLLAEGLEHIVYNRGVASFNSTELLEVMDECIFDLEPSKIFINIGSNDIGAMGSIAYKKEHLIKNYNEIMNQISKKLPNCEVYIMAYYPINRKADFGLGEFQREAVFATRTNAKIIEANNAIEELSKEYNFNFINVNDGLADEGGNLKKEYSIEGMHLLPNAYSVIFNNLKKYL